MRFIFLPLLFLAIVSDSQNPIKNLPKKGKLNLLVHPADLLVCEDMAVSFRAFAACPPPEMPDYQWQSSADGKNWDDLPNEKSPVFSSLGLAKRAHNATQFRVKVSGASDSIFSFPAMLTVESGLYFTKNPEKQIVPEGGSAIFEAAAESESGNGVASYSWQMSPYASGVWTNVPGANRPILKLENIAVSENGNSYRLLARTFNNCDSATSVPAFLVVAGKPVVSIVPLEKNLCGLASGESEATFSVQIQGGIGTEKCQWQRSKTAVGDFEILPDETKFSIKIPEIKTEMNGWTYRALVQLSDGSTLATRPGKLTVHGSVIFSKQPEDVAVCLGEAVSFSISASSEGRSPDCFWQISEDGGNFWKDFSGGRGLKLDIPIASPEMNGQKFRAVAESGLCGAVFSKTANLTVFSAVKFIAHPRDQKLTVGNPIIFLADFEEKPGGQYAISWEWSATGGSSWQFMPGGTGKLLRIQNPKNEMKDRLYRMKVLDRKCGRIAYSDAARILGE